MAIFGACDCCNKPICDNGVIECVSSGKTITCSVCGELNPDDNLYYAVKTETRTDGGTQVTTFTPDPETCVCESVIECSGSYSITSYQYLLCLRRSDYENIAITQTETISYTINADCTVTAGEAPGWSPEPDTENIYFSCVGVPTPEGEPESVQVPTPLDPVPDPVYSSAVADIPEPTITLSAFPSWDTEFPDALLGQGKSCTAKNTVAVTKDEHGNITGKTFSKQKIKWRGANRPTGTCFLQQWVKRTDTTQANPDATPPTLETTSETAAGSWTWNGTGNPCIPDATNYYSDANLIVSPDENTVDVPTLGITSVFSIGKYSCVSGYEPDLDDPTKPNEYPCPDCEAEAP